MLDIFHLGFQGGRAGAANLYLDTCIVNRRLRFKLFARIVFHMEAREKYDVAKNFPPQKSTASYQEHRDGISQQGLRAHATGRQVCSNLQVRREWRQEHQRLRENINIHQHPTKRKSKRVRGQKTGTLRTRGGVTCCLHFPGGAPCDILPGLREILREKSKAQALLLSLPLRDGAGVRGRSSRTLPLSCSSGARGAHSLT